MKKLFLFIFLFCLFATPFASHAGYASKICDASTCTTSEIGYFMQNVSQACGNSGDCLFPDIMIVFVNIGRFVLEIVAGIVLLMYVIGGFWILAAHGNDSWVKKGKGFLTGSTVGLLIVMFAAILLNTINTVLTTKV